MILTHLVSFQFLGGASPGGEPPPVPARRVPGYKHDRRIMQDDDEILKMSTLFLTTLH